MINCTDVNDDPRGNQNVGNGDDEEAPWDQRADGRIIGSDEECQHNGYANKEEGEYTDVDLRINRIEMFIVKYGDDLNNLDGEVEADYY